MSSLEGKTRANSNYLEGLLAYWENIGKPIRPPTLDHRPVDLYALRFEVINRGGMQTVTDSKQWAEVGRALGFSRDSCTSLSFTLKSIFTKIIEPFDQYLESTKELVKRNAPPLKGGYRTLADQKPPPQGTPHFACLLR